MKKAKMRNLENRKMFCIFVPSKSESMFNSVNINFNYTPTRQGGSYFSNIRVAFAHRLVCCW